MVKLINASHLFRVSRLYQTKFYGEESFGYMDNNVWFPLRSFVVQRPLFAGFTSLEHLKEASEELQRNVAEYLLQKGMSDLLVVSGFLLFHTGKFSLRLNAAGVTSEVFSKITEEEVTLDDFLSLTIQRVIQNTLHYRVEVDTVIVARKEMH